MKNYLGRLRRQLFLMVGRDSLSRRLFGRTRLCGPTFLKFTCVYLMLASFVLFFTAGCGSPRMAYRPDAEIERNAAAAKSAYTAGSLESASVFYQKALNRAWLTDQSAEIARLAYNLAACCAQMQKYDEALELLDEAQFECDAAGLDLQEIRLLRAEIARSQGQTKEALTVASAGIDALQNRKKDPAYLQFQLLVAELACDQNNSAQALKELDKIDRRLLAESAFVIQARAAAVRGRALFIEKQPAAAALCLDQAAALYQKARQYADMAKYLQRAGDAYQAAGKRQAACNRHYRAARSLFLCGENARAQESFNKASELARESSDKEMQSALARLQTEIGPAEKDKSPLQNSQP